MLKNIFDSLTTRDAELNVVPQLAESWSVLNDTVWRFRLRPGVRFHNGDMFTAADVKFTFERVLQPGGVEGLTSPRKGLLEPITEVTVIDAQTVQIETSRPWPILPLMLSLQEIVSAKHFRETSRSPQRRIPMGTGPFRFIRFEGPKRLLLERFDRYYGSAVPIPAVHTTVIKSLVFQAASSQIEQISALKQRRCDLAFPISANAVAILDETPGLVVLSSPPTRSYFAEINCTKPLFDDPRVRQALNYAINIQRVVDHLLQGRGTLLPTLVLPNAFGFHPGLKPYGYDPQRARELLLAAGFPFNRELFLYCSKQDQEFAGLIALFLTKLGIKPAIHLTASQRPRILGPAAPWDIFVGSWGNSTLDPAGILVPKFARNGKGNFSGFSQTQVDKLLVAAQGRMDPAQRTSAYQRIQEIIYREAPMIFGYAADEFYGISTRVQNFKPSATGMLDLHNVYLKDG